MFTFTPQNKFNLSLNKPGETDLQNMIDSFWYLLMCIVANSITTSGDKVNLFLPDVTVTIESDSSPVDYNEPDRVVVAKTYTDDSPQQTVQLRAVFTWTGGYVTQVVCQYDEGNGASPQWVTAPSGTITITRDGSGNMISAVPS